MQRVIAVGTEKGGYLISAGGSGWEVEGPLFPGWKVTAWGTTSGGAFLAALASNWFGVSIHRSEDLQHWEQVVDQPAFGEGTELDQVWSLTAAGDRLLAGVAPAGLFSSEDDGRSWQPVAALNGFPGRDSWFPGLGGLAAHHVLAEGPRIWVGISAVGVFRSDDGGDTFRRCDSGVTPVVEEGMEGAEAPGFCVHGIARDGGGRLWRQDHSGVYLSTDDGDHWRRHEEGLPSAFGFPILWDPVSDSAFVVPLASDENRVPVGGRFGAWRSWGDGWEPAGRGWPDSPTFTAVLRNAAAADGAGGLYLGTTGGEVWATSDSGQRWEVLPCRFPRILAVRVLR